VRIRSRVPAIAEKEAPNRRHLVNASIDRRTTAASAGLSCTDVAVAIDTLSTTPDGAEHLAGLEPGWQQNLDKLARLLEAGENPEGNPS